MKYSEYYVLCKYYCEFSRGVNWRAHFRMTIDLLYDPLGVLWDDSYLKGSLSSEFSVLWHSGVLGFQLHSTVFDRFWLRYFSRFISRATLKEKEFFFWKIHYFTVRVHCTLFSIHLMFVSFLPLGHILSCYPATPTWLPLASENSGRTRGLNRSSSLCS